MTQFRRIKVNNEKFEQMEYEKSFYVVINNQVFQHLSFKDVDFISENWSIFVKHMTTVMHNTIDDHMFFEIVGAPKHFKCIKEMFIHLKEVGCIEFGDIRELN